MIKPEKLKKGDKVAVVSLSTGLLGEDSLIHKYYIAKERLEKDFGLEVVTMENTLKGIAYLYEHPEMRAKDLMDAFKDKSIKGIFCAIGGNDTIRLLPFIDFEVIKNNPKIFMGYSDTTVNHFMLQKAGVVSYYGPSIMCEIADYGKMPDNVKKAIMDILFNDSANLEIEASKYWSDDFVPWQEENINKVKKMKKEEHGYEILQGSGKVVGPLIGGCIDVFPVINGTSLWPEKDAWKNKILLLETSDEEISPDLLLLYLRNLGAQGILDVIKGIIVGKPHNEKYYEEYKEVYKKVLKEYRQSNLPVIYNVNIGHAFFTGILPLGINIEIDCQEKKLTLMESATK